LRWFAAARLTNVSTRLDIFEVGSYSVCFILPESITYRMSFTVILVSAMFVATHTFLVSFGALANTFCWLLELKLPCRGMIQYFSSLEASRAERELGSPSAGQAEHESVRLMSNAVTLAAELGSGNAISVCKSRLSSLKRAALIWHQARAARLHPNGAAARSHTGPLSSSLEIEESQVCGLATLMRSTPKCSDAGRAATRSTRAIEGFPNAGCTQQLEVRSSTLELAH
jgi:hypothetical protein